jgi:hypothetical protein
VTAPISRGLLRLLAENIQPPFKGSQKIFNRLNIIHEAVIAICEEKPKVVLDFDLHLCYL